MLVDQSIMVVKLLKMCRFCCQNKGWSNIFHDYYSDGYYCRGHYCKQCPKLKIVERCREILRNTDIVIDENDKLPSRICPDCLEHLKSFPPRFKVDAINSYKILKEVKPTPRVRKGKRGRKLKAVANKKKKNVATSSGKAKRKPIVELTRELAPNTQIEIVSGSGRSGHTIRKRK